MSGEELRRIVLRRWLIATAAGLAVVALVLAAIALPPARYRAECRLVVDPGRQPVRFTVEDGLSNAESGLVFTQRDLLLSAGVLADALATGALAGSPVVERSTDPVGALLQRLDVVAPRETWVFAVRLVDEDPRRAERGLQAVIDAYLAAQARLERSRAEEAGAFLARQAEESRRALEDARRAEQDFRIANRIFSDDPERSFATQRLESLQGKRVVTREQVSALGTLVEQLDKAQNVDQAGAAQLLTFDVINRHPLVAEQQKLLYELDNRRADLSQRYGEKHPRMVELTEQTAFKRGQLISAVLQVVDGLRTEKDKLAAQLISLERTIAEEERELNAYKEALVRLDGLAARTRTLDEQYQQLLRRQGEEGIASRLDRVRVRVSDPPRASPRPVNRWWSLGIALAVVAGTVAAVLAAIVAERLDRRVRAGGPRLAGQKVLAQLPRLATPPIGPGDPEDALSGPLRELRTALSLVRRTDGAGRVTVVVGVGSGSGGSTVAVRLASGFAAAGSRTLVADADMRRPALARIFEIPAARGLAALLAGEPEIAPQTGGQPNLDVMPTAAEPKRASELLHSHCLAEWMAFLRAHYDEVVIDAPSLPEVGDALLLAAQADGVVLVVRDGVTRTEALTSAIADLAPLPGCLHGIVINRVGRL